MNFPFPSPQAFNPRPNNVGRNNNNNNNPNNNNQHRKGYFINARQKLELIRQTPSSKGARHAGHGPQNQNLNSSFPAFNKHDKAIIGQYKKELRKEQWKNPPSTSLTTGPPIINLLPASTVSMLPPPPTIPLSYTNLPISVVPQHTYHHQLQSTTGTSGGTAFGDYTNGQSSSSAAAADGSDPLNKKKKRKRLSKFQQAKSNFDKKLQEKNDFVKSKQVAKEQIEQAKLNRKQKRLERNKIQTQKTDKGQPLMKGRIMNLLSQLEQQQNNEHQQPSQ